MKIFDFFHREVDDGNGAESRLCERSANVSPFVIPAQVGMTSEGGHYHHLLYDREHSERRTQINIFFLEPTI